jgi:hypothetical protein
VRDVHSPYWTCCTYRILFDHGYGLACMPACMRSSSAVLHITNASAKKQLEWSYPSFPLQSAPFSPAPRHRRQHTYRVWRGACMPPWSGLPHQLVVCACLMPFFFEKALCLSIKRSLSRGALVGQPMVAFFTPFFFLHKSPFGHFVNALHAFEILCWQCRCFISYRQKF